VNMLDLMRAREAAKLLVALLSSLSMYCTATFLSSDPTEPSVLN